MNDRAQTQDPRTDQPDGPGGLGERAPLGRRRFASGLVGLSAALLAGCKIEEIRELPPSEGARALVLPDPPPQIPQRLLDTAAQLDEATWTFFLEQLAILRTSERLPTSAAAPEGLITLLTELGLTPAGPRGGWHQDVELRLVERDPEVTPRVRLKALSTDAPPDPDPDPATDTYENPRDGIELVELGLFRQRGSIDAHNDIGVRGPFSPGENPPSEQVSGRVVLIDADFELTDPDAEVRLRGVFAYLRERGAIGCLVLSDDEGPGLESLAHHWSDDQILGAQIDDALVVEGVLGSSGREQVLSMLKTGALSLSVDLGLREGIVTAKNVVARIPGTEAPDEHVLLRATWDTLGIEDELADLRLATTLATVFQLSQWARRGARPLRSITLLLAVDARIVAGDTAYAKWLDEIDNRPVGVLAVDQPVPRAPAADPDQATAPQLLFSGRSDEATSELARKAAQLAECDLIVDERAHLDALGPYVRRGLIAGALGRSENLEADADSETETKTETDADATPDADALLDTLHTLRNLARALANARTSG